MKYRHFEDAVRCDNEVAQGLGLRVFTDDLRKAEIIMALSQRLRHRSRHRAERRRDGGAFGGEKETGGPAASPAPTPGRPTCAAATNTINFLRRLRWPRASSFEVG